MVKWNREIFRKNDIRGIYKKDFDLNFVPLLAKAFFELYQKSGRNKKNLKVALGHDCRQSSPEIAQKLQESLTALGVEVFFLGMVPSPLCLFASYFKNIPSSIMITASHNPPAYNGFKMSMDQNSVCDEQIIKLKKLVENQASYKLTPNINLCSNLDIKKDYIKFYKKKFSDISKTKSSFSISIDFGNGVAGPLALKLLKSLNVNINITALFAKPDGTFPHHLPDPSIEENLKTLKKTIVEKKCDFGAAFDGDGDRLYIIDKNGKTLKGDELMFIFICDLLQKSSKKFHVVTDVKCGDWFFEFLKKEALSFTVWKSGHSLIRKKTIQKKAAFGGEFSSHFFFCNNNFPIDDGLFSLLQLLQICLSQNKTPDQLKPVTNYLETGEIRKNFKNKSKIKRNLELLKKFYKQKKAFKSFLLDGIRVSSINSWGLVRLSNTQNELTFRFGGKTKKHLEEIQKIFFSFFL